MLGDGFSILLSKFSRDARLEIRQRERHAELTRQRRQMLERLQTILKRVFLVMALVGVGVGIYFGQEMGRRMCEARYGAIEDVELEYKGIPEESAKRVRRLKDLNQGRNADFDEADQALNGAR